MQSSFPQQARALVWGYHMKQMGHSKRARGGGGGEEGGGGGRRGEEWEEWDEWEDETPKDETSEDVSMEDVSSEEPNPTPLGFPSSPQGPPLAGTSSSNPSHLLARRPCAKSRLTALTSHEHEG